MPSNIVILNDLDEYTPVYNRMEICVNESDPTTKALTDYKYIFDVYIENVSSPTYYRYEVEPDDVLGYGAVDIGRYCESAVNNTMSSYDSDVPYSLGANANGTQSIIKVTVKYGYSYSNSGVYTVVADTVVGSAKYAFNGSFDNQFFFNSIYQGTFPSTYLLNTTNSTSGQFLTDNKTNKVSIANLGWHHILTDQPTQIDRLKIVTYDSAGSIIQTVVKANGVSQALTSSRMLKVATGPKTLNNISGAFVSGAQPIITSSVASYTVQVIEGASTAISELLYFEIEEPCRYVQRRLHFLNRFGSFDSFNFNLRSQGKREVSRKAYKYDKYPITSSGIDRKFTEFQQVTNFVKTQDTMSLRSEFITEAENEWLKQLIESPEIYLEELDGAGDYNFTTVESIVGTSWIEKATSIDKLFTMDVEIKFSQVNHRQRR